MAEPNLTSVRKVVRPGVHELKTSTPFWEQVANGTKRFELRRNDRGFETGDLLVLRDYDVLSRTYTGRVIYAEVSTTLHAHGDVAGLHDGFVVMSLEVLRVRGSLGRPRAAAPPRDESAGAALWRGCGHRPGDGCGTEPPGGALPDPWAEVHGFVPMRPDPSLIGNAEGDSKALRRTVAAAGGESS